MTRRLLIGLCIGVAVGLLFLALTACRPKAAEPQINNVYGVDSPSPAAAPTGKAAPGPADPVSPGVVIARITVKCEWQGRRWFGVTVMRNGNPRVGDPRQVKYNRDGKSSDPKTGGGDHIDTLNVGPGETVSITCAPHPDRPNGEVGCFVLHHRAIVVRKQESAGTVTCSYTVPTA